MANLLGAFALAASDRLLEATSAVGESPSVDAALVALRNHPGESIRTLQSVLGLTHSGTVRLLDGLEAAELVERRRGMEGDARAVAVWPTAKGKKRAEALLMARTKALEEILEGVDDSSRTVLEQALRQMLDNLTNGPPSARRICRFCEERVCRPAGCPVEDKAGCSSSD